MSSARKASWRLVRCSRRWGSIFDGLAKRRGKKKAIVAIARRLLTVMTALLRLAGPSVSEKQAPNFRRYEQKDHDAVWRLHRAALEQVTADAGPGPWDDDLHQIEEVYQRAGGEFLVAEADGVVVGMGGLKGSGPRCDEIRRMRVAPSYQRRGIGRTLLAALEQRLPRQHRLRDQGIATALGRERLQFLDGGLSR